MEGNVIFTPTPLIGAYLIDPEHKRDQRGSFARVWCREEFAERGIDADIVQASSSHNKRAGTLRGLHFAWPPSRESKLVRCERGAVFDVIVDLRPDSSTFLLHAGASLDDANGRSLYIPPGFAHGFQTLADNTVLLYMMTDVYRPELADGVRFDDPTFRIRWPLPVTAIMDRDRSYPNFDRKSHERRYREYLESCVS